MFYFWLMLAAAAAPALYLLYFVYRADKVDKEPPQLLFRLFLFGMLSVIPALVLELLAQYLVNLLLPQGSVLYLLVESFFGVALIEEGCKYAFLKKGAWRHPAFNYTFDGVVYAVFVSLGFALVENVKYVFHFGLGVGIQRAFLAVPLHACCAVYMGLLFGRAKGYFSLGNGFDGRKALRKALWVPVFFHGFYDYCLFVGNALATIVFYGFVAVLFFFTYRTLRKQARQDQRIGYDPYQE